MNSQGLKNTPLALRLLVQVIFILYAFSILFVIYYMVVNGSKTQADYAVSRILPGSTFEWRNYYDVWVKHGLGAAFMNSFAYSTISVLCTLLFSSLAAFAFSLLEFPGRTILYWIILITMYMSAITLIIPLYLQFISLGLNNSPAGLIILYTGTRLAFSIFLLTTYFNSLSREMFEAARIDGCGDMRILFSIIMPLSKPTLVTLIILNFSSAWNDLFFASIFLQNPKLSTVMMVVAGFKGGKYMVNFVYIFTSLAILVIPLIILYMLGQKYFTAGIMSGSVKE